MKILVPVDGSKDSIEAVKVAAQYAKALKAETLILTVVPFIADIDLELSASDRDRLLESMKRRGEDVLKRASEQVKAAGVEKVSTILATATSPAGEIIAQAEKERAHMVVIGSRGLSASTRFNLGSVSAAVVRHSPSCVCVVKEPCWQ